MFKTKCFIRKNTPELRGKLGKMGYRVCRCTGETTAVYLMAGHGDIHAVHDELVDIFEDEVKSGTCKLIDCGDNELLFLALAAMRDDTDKDQYFVHDEEIHWVNQGAYIPKGSLFKCLVDKYYLDPDNTTPKFHRATVNEIIDYFQSQKS